MILISACLAGFNCKYNAKNNFNASIEELVKNKIAVPICPEQAGGMPTPRVPAEILGGDGLDVIEGRARVITSEGEDVTLKFFEGAKEALKLAKLVGANKAILKSRSPSCGCCKIYDGTFKGVLRAGMGVSAAYLLKHGIEVIDSDEFIKK
ncbi:MAG: DUF523 domain-containing protein [Tepidanaerobacteraceae bacterium]|jgi:uncharacterized protein YbbK (DUF523 family)|nr:DUF523 domain-containing protein [Tepidanaerobacteraceae bacterium]